MTRTSHGALTLINPFMMDDTTRPREAGVLLKAAQGQRLPWWLRWEETGSRVLGTSGDGELSLSSGYKKKKTTLSRKGLYWRKSPPFRSISSHVRYTGRAPGSPCKAGTPPTGAACVTLSHLRVSRFPPPRERIHQRQGCHRKTGRFPFPLPRCLPCWPP